MAFSVTLSKRDGGTGGTESFAFDPDTGKAYSDLSLRTEITSIEPPTIQGFSFDGYFGNSGLQYIGSNGELLDRIYDRTWTSNITIYARFTRLSYVMTLDDGSGYGGPGKIYYKIDGGGWFKDEALTDRISVGDALVQPRRDGYKSAGYYDHSDGTWGTRITGSQGVVRSELGSLALTDDVTYTARWYNVYSVDLDPSDEDLEKITIYYCSLSGVKYCSDELCDHPISALAKVHSRKYFSLRGYYSSSSGGTKYINADGSFAAGIPASVSEDVTWHAQYVRLSYHINVKDENDSKVRISLYAPPEGGRFYKDWKLENEETSLFDKPSKECFSFSGAFSGKGGGGTKYIEGSGAFTNAFKTRSFDANINIYIAWERRSYRISIDRQGGTGGTNAIYTPVNPQRAGQFYSDDTVQWDPITSIVTPSRAGYAFVSCRASASGGATYVNTNGNLTDDLKALTISADMTIYARWNAQQYLLEFNANGGMTPTHSKVVTMGARVGELPTPTLSTGVFLGWHLDGTEIGEDTVWNTPHNATAIASWRYFWGNLTDWFGLGSEDGPLMLVASTDGATRTVIETAHTGRIDNVNAYGVLLNPVCTYRIRKPGKVTIDLGSAYGSFLSPSSCYMLVSAEYATASDGEPALVVRGAANEGAPAINRWSVELDVNPDHIAQDPKLAVSGGGELTECRTLITCDPVVPMENGMPCASDIVHGKIVVTATTNAYFGESAPRAGSSFIETSVPTNETDVDFTTYAFQAERSL